MKKYYFVILALIFIASSIIAQDDSSKSSSWTNIGSFIKDYAFFTHKILDGGAHASYNRNIGNIYGQLFIAHQVIPREQFVRYDQVIIGIGAGKRYSARYLLAAAFAGPSVSWERYISFKHPTASYLGVHLNQQIFFKPIREIGLGIVFIQNINAYKSFAAYHITLTVMKEW